MVQAADGAVADGDQEALAGHRRVAKHGARGRGQVDAVQRERAARARHARHVAVHLGRLAQQDVHRHVDGALALRAVLQHQLALLGGDADDGEGAAFALAHGGEERQAFRRDHQDVALLALVAPDLLGRQAAFLERDLAQVEDGAAAGIVDQFREGVGDAARADVMDRQDGVALGQAPAMVDDFLRAALDLGVAALDRVEVQVGGVGARGHRAGRAAAHADAHAGAAELDQQRAGGELDLLGEVGADRAQAAGDHDRLVVPAANAVDVLLEDAEVAAQRGPAELVVEGGAAERPLGHDLQRAGDVRGLADRVLLPRLAQARQMQVGDREAGQAGLGLGAATGGALVADLAAGAGGRARMRGDGRRVVVSLDLHQHVRGLGTGLVLRRAAIAGRHPALDGVALHHRGVVGVGDDGVLRRHLLGVADHAEERQRLRFTVDGELGVEDLVAAVLAVGLREHHQLDVAGVAAQLLEGGDEVVDLVVGERQAPGAVGFLERRAAAGLHRHVRERLGLLVVEEVGGVLARQQHAFGHAVMQQVGAGQQLLLGQRLGAAGQPGQQPGLEREAELGDALHPVQGQAAVVGDVGGLGGPGAQRAQARGDDDQRALGGAVVAVAVVQQRSQLVAALRVQRRVGPDPVDMTGMHRGDAVADGLQTRQQRRGPEGREGIAPLEVNQMLGGGGAGHGIPGGCAARAAAVKPGILASAAGRPGFTPAGTPLRRPSRTDLGAPSPSPSAALAEAVQRDVQLVLGQLAPRGLHPDPRRAGGQRLDRHHLDRLGLHRPLAVQRPPAIGHRAVHADFHHRGGPGDDRARHDAHAQGA